VVGFHIRDRGDCKYYAMAELPFIDMVRPAQQVRLADWRERLPGKDVQSNISEV
jgi:hypothetical protein